MVVASLATARMQRTAPAVQTEPWDLVIVDEAHRVKRRGSASYHLIDGLRSRFLLLLTATPIEPELEELYQLVTLLRPGQFGAAVARRRDRERARLDEYFRSLIAEAERPRRQIARDAIRARVDALRAEHAAKLRDLGARYMLCESCAPDATGRPRCRACRK